MSMRAAINEKCKVSECTGLASKAKMCNAHYLRWTRYGRLHSVRRKKGTGTIKDKGYVAIGINRRLTYEHILIAEKAIGKPLPKKAEVHHVEGKSNKNTNLVICPSRAYHMMLHQRARALETCGHADWPKCGYCGEYDNPRNMKHYKSSKPRHSECAVRYLREWRARNGK